VLEYLPGLFDLVLVMTVNPGFGGQAFIPQTLVKIEKIRKMIDGAGLDVEIQVDGGINPSTAPLVVRAGATVLVAGSAIFSAPDPAAAIRDIRRVTENIRR
jgi:ribulose-phosphate 3-epimerase